MAGTPKQPRTVKVFIDESGTTADSSFVVAGFFTVAVDAWRWRFQRALDDERDTYVPDLPGCVATGATRAELSG